MRTMRLSLALIASLALTVAGCLGARSDGPLQPNGAFTVGLPLQSAPVTWATPLGALAKPYVLSRVDLVGVSGFDIVAVMACEGSPKVGEDYISCGGVGEPWPPPGVTLRNVDGTTIGTAPEDGASILVAVQLSQGASSGRIDRMRIYYRYEGVDYVAEMPWALEMPYSQSPP
jgi:hypothetical protein